MMEAHSDVLNTEVVHAKTKYDQFKCISSGILVISGC